MSPTPASDLVWHGGRLGGRLGFFAVLVALVSIVAGCGEKPKLSSSSEKSAQNVVLGVVGDAALADSIGRLKAEWHAVTGNTLEVVPLESTAFLVGAGGNESSSDSAVFKPDALVVPATELGTLAEADRLAPVPLDVRASAAAAWSDIFLLAQQGAVWGDDIWAVPLGTPQLTLLYRRDLFDELGRTPPTTWAEYQTLVEFFANRDKLAGSAQSSEAPPADAKWYGTLEPLGGGWGAKTLLARAACYAKHRDNFSVLFTIEDFKPLVDGPPFVRALEELVAANRGSEAATAERLALDPAGVRTAFFAGQSAMALSWPTAAGSPQPVEVKVGFVELPGGSKMFNYALNRWDDRTADESIHVPIVPLEGRLGVVMKSSPHTSVAFELLAWLAGDNWGTRVASASTATTLYRRSQQRDAAQWVEMGIDRSTAHDYGQLAGHAASHSVWVDGLRIPGWPEYYAALDDAVAKALRGEASATDALKTAAETFATISDRLGVETQRAAYRRNLGLEP